MSARPNNTIRLIKLHEVRTITGKSRSSIYSDPDFPKPVKIGARASAWVESEILKWVEARLEQRAEAEQ